MAEIEGKNARTTVADLVARLAVRPLPVIAQEATADEVISAFAGSIHARLLYFLDSEGRLAGVISLGRLVRHVLSSYHEPEIHPRHILNGLCSDTAQHLMQKDTISALLTEELAVLQRMINHNAKEIAVLDPEQKVVADLTMADILKYYKSLDDGSG